MRISRRGSALLTVLWLTAALSAIGLAVANNVRGETERTSTAVDDAKSYFAARGAIERAGLRMLWSASRPVAEDQPTYYRRGSPSMDFDFPDAAVQVAVIPETARLDINSIRPEFLLRLLAALSVPADRATELTSAIVDWRTRPDALHESPYDSFYLSQTPSFLPTHTSFKENEELLLVRGMTPDIYYGTLMNGTRGGLRDCVSVYGSPAGVDINSAEPATLQAIGISAEDTQAIVRLRTQHPILDYKELGEIQKAAGAQGALLRIGGNTMFTLRATARLKESTGRLSDLRRTVAALVKVTFQPDQQGRQPGVEVVRWYDRF